jgi:hypothetical protein
MFPMYIGCFYNVTMIVYNKVKNYFFFAAQIEENIAFCGSLCSNRVSTIA